jgi:DNA replication protein DnaC
MDKGLSPGDTPPTSNTNPTSNGDLCSICGQFSICGGLGVVSYNVPFDHPQFGKLVRCPNNPIDQDAERQERFRKLSNLAAYADKNFANFETRLPTLPITQIQSLEIARNKALSFANQPESWLLLEGTYGCGKTHLAAAVGNERLNRGDMVLFITAPDLLDHLRSTYGPSSEVAYDQIFDRIRNAQLLIIDDLGAENPSAWAQEKLFQLLNHRYSQKLPTVITTNSDIDTFDPRIRSRLLDENLVQRIRITAPDYRSPNQSKFEQITNIAQYGDMTFDNFDTYSKLDADERKSLRYVADYAWNYAQQPEKWLVILGKYGSGKTHLAAAIANHHIMRQTNTIFVTIPDLMDYLRTAFQPGMPVSFDQRFNAVRNADLLILDDLGTENATAWAKEKLFQILDHRYAAQLPTVITTAKEIERLDERLASRLLDQRRCIIIAITTPGYYLRMKRS